MTPSRFRKSSRRAFTLVELLVVIGIIAVLISVLLPSLSRARQSASAAMCMSNLRQMYTFFMDYARAHNDFFPAPWVGLGNPGFNTWAYQWPYLIWAYARPAPMPRGFLPHEGPLGAINNPDLPGPNGGGWGFFGPIHRPTVSRARVFFCPTAVQNGIGITGGRFNPDPDSWITTYSYVQSARGRNPWAPTAPPDYNLWGYPRPSRARNPSEKIMLTDTGGNWEDRLRPVPDCFAAFITMTNDAAGNPRHGRWLNPHNNASNMLFFDGHVERRDPRSLRRYNFRHDE